MTFDDAIRILVFVIAAFLPPLLYLVWIRNTERYGKEPWGAMLKTFAWGAIIAVIIAIILSLILISIYQQGMERIYVSYGVRPTLDLLILSVVIAPFTEEFAKGIGVYTVRNDITEEEDGLIYGASCGLGFAATENLLYGVIAYLAGGWISFFTLIILRSIASALLHASASALMGYGIAKSLTIWERAGVLPYYLGAVGMHAAFNLLASMGVLYEANNPGDPNALYIHLFSLMIVIFFAVIAMGFIRRKIRSYDRSREYPVVRQLSTGREKTPDIQDRPQISRKS
jgi:RsiW-degrading membrane proteinase PrsW (M82 family)